MAFLALHLDMFAIEEVAGLLMLELVDILAWPLDHQILPPLVILMAVVAFFLRYTGVIAFVGGYSAGYVLMTLEAFFLGHSGAQGVALHAIGEPLHLHMRFGQGAGGD